MLSKVFTICQSDWLSGARNKNFQTAFNILYSYFIFNFFCSYLQVEPNLCASFPLLLSLSLFFFPPHPLKPFLTFLVPPCDWGGGGGGGGDPVSNRTINFSLSPSTYLQLRVWPTSALWPLPTFPSLSLSLSPTHKARPFPIFFSLSLVGGRNNNKKKRDEGMGGGREGGTGAGKTWTQSS